MITCTIELYGLSAELAGTDEVVLELPGENADMQELIIVLKTRLPELDGIVFKKDENILADDQAFNIDGRFYCLNRRTGETLWTFDAEAEIDSGANFYRNHVLFGSQDATLYCLNINDGKLVWKYPTRVALNPFFSTLGWQLAGLISGQTLLAVVLSLQTTGPLLLRALTSQDMYLAGSFLLLLSTLTVIGTLVSDILLAWVDPRIRLEG